ncbi:hypothetical protein NUW58_g7112 [Xylaria curta]|uniref:Uncharacterized protein n=1 Tax=Xylaria curta TaxID=42375 RepID=A0ACC1NMH0_9PEZI|nr:hypothetical protein NUW58_g7112 [Xylaria curta]
MKKGKIHCSHQDDSCPTANHHISRDQQWDPLSGVLSRVANHTVIGPSRQLYTFKNLHSAHGLAERILIILVRNFACGTYNCRASLTELPRLITPEAALGLETTTAITVIGCFPHVLINQYIKETGCRFNMFVDPTCKLYQDLGMKRMLKTGDRPAYVQGKASGSMALKGVGHFLKRVPSELAKDLSD